MTLFEGGTGDSLSGVKSEISIPKEYNKTIEESKKEEDKLKEEVKSLQIQQGLKKLCKGNKQGYRYSNQSIEDAIEQICRRQTVESQEVLKNYITHAKNPEKTLIEVSNLMRGSGVAINEAITRHEKGYKTSDLYSQTLDTSNSYEADSQKILNILKRNIEAGVSINEGIKLSSDIFFQSQEISSVDHEGGILKLDDLPPQIKERVTTGLEHVCNEKVLSLTENILDNNKDLSANYLSNHIHDYPELQGVFTEYLSLKQPSLGDGDVNNNDTGSSNNKKREIQEEFKAFLSLNGYEVNNVDQERLKRLREHNERMYEGMRRRFEERKKRNRALNERLSSIGLSEFDKNEPTSLQKSLNTQEASGAEIVANEGLGKQLSNFDVKEGGKLTEEQEKYLKYTAFDVALEKFLQAHDEMKDIITRETMLALYDIASGQLDENARERFKRQELQLFSEEEQDLIHRTLSTFPNEVTTAMKSLSENSYAKMGEVHETVKTHALGAVIDNIKDIFSQMSEDMELLPLFQGFEFRDSKPVKIEGNSMMIYGKMWGTTTNIRYDLNSGSLYINSFIKEHTNPSKITIGNEDPDLKIGELASFDDILNDFYKTPTLSLDNNTQEQYESNYQPDNPIENTAPPYNPDFPPKIPRIEDLNRTRNPQNFGGRKISEDATRYQGLKNRIPGGNNRGIPRPPIPQMGIKLPEESKSRFVDNIGNLKQENKLRFQKMLGTKMDLIGKMVKDYVEKQSTKNSVVNSFLKTFYVINENNVNKSLDFQDGSNLFEALQILENSDAESLQNFSLFMEEAMKYSGLQRGQNSENQDKKNQYSEKIFTGTATPSRLYLKSKIENVDAEKRRVSQTLNFDSDFQLGFADLIKEKLATGTKPNRKLDTIKMNNFLKDIENDNKTDNDENADNMLDEALANV